uniref:Uncharacterized protein n=1 Tax=Strongyloides stercoralis TaxID=6248 RepID=A0AAF5HXR2_STRER
MKSCKKFMESFEINNKANIEDYNYQSVILRIKNYDKLKMYALVTIVLLFISKYNTLHQQYTILSPIKRFKNDSGCDEWVKMEENVGEYLCISIIYITTAIQIWNVR